MTLLPVVAARSVTTAQASTSFAEFDRRARMGERLNIVFFGASLTWGANASDPQKTSYRAVVARKMEATYPRAHLRFFDAAIGGTGSQLAVFRLQRDVLRHHPDLVFLDFSANDEIYSADPETLASYESLVRRIIIEAKCPLMQVFFPFKGNIKTGEMEKMKRRTAHLEIARAYNCAVGDAIATVMQRVLSGQTKLETVWPIDGAHPGDRGYEMFAESAFAAFQSAVREHRVCRAPAQMLYEPTYMKWNRARISQLGPLPTGWKIGIPNRTSAYFDFLMSRWLDDEVIASNGTSNGDKPAAPVDRLRVKFKGTLVMLFGEATLRSSQYRAYIDGAIVHPNNSATTTEFDPAAFAKAINGNGHHVQIIAASLDPNIEHTLEIEPLFASGTAQELRLESICVAGGDAIVSAL